MLYDDSAAVFFGITVLVMYLCVAVPHITYVWWTWKPEEVKEPEKPKGRTAAERDKLARLNTETKKAPEKPVLFTRNFTIYCAFTGLMALALVILFYIGSQTQQLASYDPYAILLLGRGASESEIKSAYRKLSRIYHPDVPGGSVEKQSEIIKAYETLTDPVARENYEKYGNPDGRQAFKISVGLPSFLAGGVGGYLTLALYMVALLVGAPYAMYKVYRNQAPKQEPKVHPQTGEAMVKRLGPNMDITHVLELISDSMEFNVVPFQPGDLEEVENIIGIIHKRFGILHNLSAMKLALLPEPLRRRNLALLYAHLARHPVMSPSLREAQHQILKKAYLLTQAVCDTAAVVDMQFGKNKEHKPLRGSAISAVKLSQLLTQALFDKNIRTRDISLRMILPETEIRQISLLPANAGCCHTLEDFVKLPADRRPRLDLPEAEKQEIDAIVRDLPRIQILVGLHSPQFGWNKVVSGFPIHPIVTVRHLNVEGVELHVPEAGKEEGEPPADTEGRQASLPPVYAPHLPIEPEEDWVFFLCGPQDKLISFGRLNGRKAVETIALRPFEAPPARSYTWKLYAMSTIYPGLDQEIPVTFRSKTPEEMMATLAANKPTEASEAADEDHGHSHGDGTSHDDAHDHAENDDDDSSSSDEDQPMQAIDTYFTGAPEDTSDYDSDEAPTRKTKRPNGASTTATTVSVAAGATKPRQHTGAGTGLKTAAKASTAESQPAARTASTKPAAAAVAVESHANTSGDDDDDGAQGDTEGTTNHTSASRGAGRTTTTAAGAGAAASTTHAAHEKPASRKGKGAAATAAAAADDDDDDGFGISIVPGSKKGLRQRK